MVGNNLLFAYCLAMAAVLGLMAGMLCAYCLIVF